MKISQDVKLDFDDVLLVPQRSKHSSRKDVVLEREFKFYHSPRIWKGIPICVSNMDTTGSMAMGTALRKHKVITCLHKFYSIDSLIEYYGQLDELDYVWLSIGMKDEDLKKLETLKEKLGFQVNLCIDIANGYTETYIKFLHLVRQLMPESIIMAGNVCTEEMVAEYILHGGVDIVKLGIGPGSVCTTRLKTGVGYPQLSCISSCSHKAHGLYSQVGHLGLVCGDGGHKNPGDICKSLCAGSDFVMLGGTFAGAKECEGVWEYEWKDYKSEKISWSKYDWDDTPFQEIKTGNKRLRFHGMSSKEAMEEHHGEMADYKTAEGIEITVPYKGKAEDILYDILGGIRSCCAYIGAKTIKEDRKSVV